MTKTTTFDPAQYKADLRTEWRDAAPGWRAWVDVLEAASGGQAVSRTLVELAGIGPGTRCWTWPPATASPARPPPGRSSPAGVRSTSSRGSA
jgi:hypothetical protein